MLATGILSVSGFVFWIICSHVYSPTEIGLATSLTSIASLLTTLSIFGLNNVIVRFLPSRGDKNNLISSALIVTSIGSIIASFCFFLWAIWTRSYVVDISSLYVFVPIFVILVTAQSLNIICESTFVAYRDTKYVLFKNVIFGIAKIIFPLSMLSLGTIGIVCSITGATILGLIGALSWLIVVFKFKFSSFIDKIILKEVARFATSNYIANIFGLLPSSLLPLIIVSRVGAQAAAFFYMPLMIIALINIIPNANAQALFAEASHDERNLVCHLKKALQHLFVLLVPTVLVVLVSGYWVLNLFGHAYATAGLPILQVLSISSFIGSMNYFGDTLLNIKKQSGLYVIMNMLNAIIIVVLAFVAAPHGILAVALSSLIGQVMTLIVYAGINRRLLVEMTLG